MKKTALLIACSLLLTSLAPTALGGYVGPSQPVAASQRSNGWVVPADPAGVISFANLAGQMRENNLTIKNCQETLASYQAMDRQKAYNNIVDAINGLSDVIWAMVTSPGAAAMTGQVQQMQAQVESLRDQLETLEEEEYQKTMDDLARQIENAIDQIIMGGQSLYITIATYENQAGDLTRGLATLERTLAEMELRYQRGQISQLTLEQLRSTYHSTQSQQASLTVGLNNMRASLESLVGQTPTGTLRITALPGVSAASIATMSYEEDLAAAKEASFTLYQADQTFEDAQEAWDDAKKDYSPSNYNYKMAEHTYQAAVYAHEAAYQSFQVSFDTLYRAVADAQQTLTAAQSALAYQQQTFASSQLQYDLGKLSYNGLLTAQDDLAAAQSQVTSAAISLFTAWNNYRWAADAGLISGGSGL